MRTIKRIFIHCTAGYQSSYSDAGLVAEFKRKGWSAPGYHYVVRPDGSIFNMWPEDKISNGVAGFNSTAINISYVGGVDKTHPKGIDNRTDAQKQALIILLQDLKKKYPNAVIMGHRDASPDKNGNGIIEPSEYIKACPCFNAMEEYKNIGNGPEHKCNYK